MIFTRVQMRNVHMMHMSLFRGANFHDANMTSLWCKFPCKDAQFIHDDGNAPFEGMLWYKCPFVGMQRCKCRCKCPFVGMSWCKCPFVGMLWCKCPFVGISWCKCLLGNMTWRECPLVGMQWCKCLLGNMPWCKCPLIGVQWCKCLHGSMTWCECPLRSMPWCECSLGGITQVFWCKHNLFKNFLCFQNEAFSMPETKIFSKLGLLFRRSHLFDSRLSKTGDHC